MWCRVVFVPVVVAVGGVAFSGDKLISILTFSLFSSLFLLTFIFLLVLLLFLLPLMLFVLLLFAVAACVWCY